VSAVLSYNLSTILLSSHDQITRYSTGKLFDRLRLSPNKARESSLFLEQGDLAIMQAEAAISFFLAALFAYGTRKQFSVATNLRRYDGRKEEEGAVKGRREESSI